MPASKKVTRKKAVSRKKATTSSAAKTRRRKKAPAAGKKTRKKAATSKKAAAKKAPARKKAAAKKAPARKKAASRKKPVSKKKPTSKKRASTKKAPAAKKKSRSKKKTAAKKKPASKKKIASKKRTAARKASPAKKATARKPARRKKGATAKQTGRREKRFGAHGPLHGFQPYHQRAREEYMSDEMLEHFRQILFAWKRELMEEVDRTVGHMKDEAANFPDPNDRATQESEFSLELRTRDRERKLLRKIDSALKRIEDGSYGYCAETGEEIGLKRLEARPVATLSVEAQERRELAEKQYRDWDDR